MKLTFLRGTGRRRAADRLQVVTAERDLWIFFAIHAGAQLATACQQRDTTAAVANLLREDLDGLQAKHEETLDELDAMTARHRETTSDLANLRAITTPAPADGPRIILTDPDTTVGIPIKALWDAIEQPGQAA